MNFVRAETLVQEITVDGKVRDIVTERVKSEAEKEADRKEQILRDLPEFKREKAAGLADQVSKDQEETQEEKDKEKDQEQNKFGIDEEEFEHYQKLEDAEREKTRQRVLQETAAVQRFATERKRALESGEVEGPDLLAKMARQARDKAEEIDAKALQEFTIEKFKIVNQTKQKVRDEYQKKTKQLETQHAIQRSSAINKSRLEKIRARQEVLGKVADEAKKGLMEELKSDATNSQFITKLILQGLLMLLEENVEVRCRASDDALVSSCLDKAAKEYAAVILKETGRTKSVKCTLSKTEKLPPAPTGAPGASGPASSRPRGRSRQSGSSSGPSPP